MARVLSGIQPTGEVHLGNYLGALRNWVTGQHANDAFHFIVDLHALTFPQDPAVLRRKTLELATMLVAIGLDPEVTTLFVQSHVPEHSQLAWLMECNVAIGELQRMTQFKEKSSRSGSELISCGLLTYPALQAADILLYDADEVPVGDDQRQHIELTREIATRMNNRAGRQVFVLPKAVHPAAGARVMDLQEPTKKMSKSIESPQGIVLLSDSPEVMVKKFKRAVTDSDNEVRYDRAAKPGVSNLLDIYAACTDTTAEAAAAQFTQYGALKQATADAVVEVVRPIQKRFEELSADPSQMGAVLAKGAAKARAVASVTLARAQEAVGLLPAQ
ncbi:MAG: trpS [Acidimicrobiia bacterium]|nr:trpS [Acidimicrobiia bacterium]